MPVTAAAGVLAVGIVLVVSVIVLERQRKPESESTTAPPVATAATKGKTGPQVPVLTIDWPEDQRARASLFVNDVPREIPLRGPIEIPLPPTTGQYDFRLERPGFQPKRFARASGTEDQGYKATDWEPIAQGIDWKQDFDAAKKTAAAEHKNVLVLFDASDSKQSAFASNRFAEAVANRREFRERADREYVCVYIDNPQGDEAKRKVSDADRNQKLIKLFRVKVFPTVVVTDPRGRQFGILEDYKINGINSFLQLMKKWEADGKILFEMLAAIDSMPKENRNPDLVAKFFDFLEINDLDRFYRGYIKELTPLLPQGENRPATEMARIWGQKFYLATGNPDEAKKVVDRFDEWKKSRTFKDHDLAAELHLMAAEVLLRAGGDLRKEAAEKCKEGLAFSPQDPMVRSLLERYMQALTGEESELPAGSGSGFCVAQGNYVLTNHHVIEDAKKIKVHLNGEKERYDRPT